MKNILVTLSILLISAQNLCAAPTMIATPTDTYILSISDSSLLHFDHQTKKRFVLRERGLMDKARIIGFLHFNDLIYVTYGTGVVGTFDFKTHDKWKEKELDLPYPDALPMHIHNHYGYVAHKTDKRLSVIDLRTFTVFRIADLPYPPHFMTIDENHAYLLCGPDTNRHLIEVDLLNNYDMRVCSLSIHEPTDIKIFNPSPTSLIHVLTALKLLTFLR